MSYIANVPGPAPRTWSEFHRLFNCFKMNVLAFTLIDQPVAVRPEQWPLEFWQMCECGSR